MESPPIVNCPTPPVISNGVSTEAGRGKSGSSGPEARNVSISLSSESLTCETVNTRIDSPGVCSTRMMEPMPGATAFVIPLIVKDAEIAPLSNSVGPPLKVPKEESNTNVSTKLCEDIAPGKPKKPAESVPLAVPLMVSVIISACATDAPMKRDAQKNNALNGFTNHLRVLLIKDAYKLDEKK